MVVIGADAVERGISRVIFSAEGPDDVTVKQFDQLARDAGLRRPQAAQAIGGALAEVLKRLLDRTSLRRVVISGGDSSGEIVSALGIQALTATALLIPGATLCQAWSEDPNRNGLEMVLKGGQMGAKAFQVTSYLRRSWI